MKTAHGILLLFVTVTAALVVAATSPAPRVAKKAAPVALGSNAAVQAATKAAGSNAPAAAATVPQASPLDLVGPATNAPAGDVEEVAEVATAATLRKPPEVIEIKRQVGAVQKEGVTIFTREFNIDGAENIKELFQRCRDLDIAVKKAGKTAKAVRAEKMLADAVKSKKFVLKRLRGACFDLVCAGPPELLMIEKSKPVKKTLDEVLQSILNGADGAFRSAVDTSLMSSFINWSVVRGRIYVICDPEDWRSLRTGDVRGRPVQIANSDPATREFYVHVAREHVDYADQAVGFAVAEAVYGEYAKVISGKSKVEFPLFFLNGLAANAASLQAVVTETGPKQVALVENRKILRPDRQSRAMIADRPGILPLKKTRLIAFKDLVSATQYPSGDEEVYYFILQSSAAVDFMRSQAPLAFLVLAKELAGGREIKTAVDKYYIKVQQDIMGKEVSADKRGGQPRKESDKSKASADTKSSSAGKEVVADEEDERFADYTKMARVMDGFVFYHLTEDYLLQKKADEQRVAAGGSSTLKNSSGSSKGSNNRSGGSNRSSSSKKK